MAMSNFVIQTRYPEWTTLPSILKPDSVSSPDSDDIAFNSLRSLYQFDRLVSLESSASVSCEPRVNGLAFRCLSQDQNSDESLLKTNGILIGIDRTLFYLRSDPPGPPPTLFHFKESLIDVLSVSDDSRFASVVLRNGLVTFYDLTCTEGPREIFRFKLLIEATLPKKAEQLSSVDKFETRSFLSVSLSCNVYKFDSCQQTSQLRNTDHGVENSLGEDGLPSDESPLPGTIIEQTSYSLVTLSANNKLHVLENLLLEPLASNTMSEKEVAEQLVARVLALDSLQMNCSSMEVVPAALVHIDALLPLQLADRLQHTGCAPPISPNKQVDAQCEARPQPLPNPLFQSGWSTLDLFSDSVSLFDIPPGPDSGLALDLPDVDEVDGAAVHLPSESPQTAAVTRAQSPPLHEALSESDNYLVFLGTGKYCVSVVRLSGSGFRVLNQLESAAFSSSGTVPSRVELLSLDEPDGQAEEASGGLPLHLLVLDSAGELTLWHLPTLIRVHVWQLPSPVLDMALVPSSTSPHRLLLLYRVPCSQSSPQQPSPLVLQVSELLCADPFDKPLYRYKSTLFVRLIRGMLDQAKYAFVEGDLISGDESMDTARIHSPHPNSISLLTFFEASPTEKLNQLLHLRKFQEAEELVKLYPNLDIELLYQVKANYLLESLKQMQDRDRTVQNRARTQLRRSIAGGERVGSRSVPPAASDQQDWRTLYSELRMCLENLRSIDLALECARCCPLPDLSANLELLDLCKSKVRARIELVEASGTSDNSSEKSQLEILESNLDEIEEIYSLLGTYALLHTDMPIISEPDKLMRTVSPAAMQSFASDLAFLTKDWETFRSHGLLQHLFDRLAAGDLSAFFIIWYRHPQMLCAHLISDNGHKLLEIVQRLPLLDLVTSLYGICTRSAPIGSVNRASLELLAEQQVKLAQLSRFHSLLHWLRTSLLPILFEYHIHNALCSLVTFTLDCANRVATLVEERESKSFCIITASGDQNPILELLFTIIAGCSHCNPLRNESSASRAVAPDDLEAVFCQTQSFVNGNPATAEYFSDFRFSCCLLPPLYLIDASQLRTVANGLEEVSKTDPSDILLTLRLNFLRILILTRELCSLERLRREYNFEISAKQYREAIVRAKDSGGIWSVEEVLVLKRLNQLSNDDLLRMQYTSCLVKFMLENHVNEERIVLQHISEILDDYQKHQQMARANPSTTGVPASSENRWIQRCLVLLSIATLTRKTQLEYLAKLAEIASIPWPKELELQMKRVLNDPSAEAFLPEEQRQRFRHLLQLLELKTQLTNKYGVTYVPTRDSVNSENLEEELEQFACLLLRNKGSLSQHEANSLSDSLFGVVADIINYRFWLFGSCPLSLQYSLYIKRLRYLVEMNKSSECLLWFATTQGEYSSEGSKSSTDCHGASFALKLRVAHLFVQEVLSKMRRLEEATEQEIFPLVEFANALTVLLVDSRLTQSSDNQSHSKLRRKLGCDQEELQALDTIHRYELKLGIESHKSLELLLETLKQWVRDKLDSQRNDAHRAQLTELPSVSMPPPLSTPNSNDKRASVKPAVLLAKASLAFASVPLISAVPSHFSLSINDCLQFVSLVQLLRLDWTAALNTIYEIFLMEGDNFSGVCDALSIISEIISESNERRQNFSKGLYMTLKKILNQLRLPSGDEASLFEYLPNFSSSLLKLVRLLISESVSSVYLRTLFSCERLLMVFSFLTSSSLTFFSSDFTDTNSAEAGSKMPDPTMLLFKPIVSISENNRDLFRSVLPRLANSLIRLLDRLINDPLEGEQLVLVARAYEELLGQLSPTASYNYVAFQVEQQLIEFCFEHLLHIIAQPLIYSRSRVNSQDFFVTLLRLIQAHSLRQSNNVLDTICETLNGSPFDTDSSLSLLVHLKRLVSLRTEGDMVLSVDKHPVSRILVQLIRAEPQDLQLMKKCARTGFTFGALRDEESICRSWFSFLQRVLTFQRIEPCLRLDNETLAIFFCENRLSTPVAANILHGAPRQSGSVFSVIKLCELIAPNLNLELDTLLSLLERLLIEDALSLYETVLSKISISSRASSPSLHPPESRARHCLISERISQVIYAKLEPELQALLRRLCTLLPEANADKRSAILGRLVQNIIKINPYFFEVCSLYKQVLEAYGCFDSSEHAIICKALAFASGYLRCYQTKPSGERSLLDEYLHNICSKRLSSEELDQTIKGSPSASIPAVKATLFSEITSTPQTGSPVCANSAFSTPMGNTPTTSSFLATQSSPLISRTMAIVSHLSRYRLPLTSFVSFANGVSNAASADELTKLLDDCFGREVCESTMRFWSGFLSSCHLDRTTVNDLIQTKVIESAFKHYLIAHHGKSSIESTDRGAAKSKLVDSAATLDNLAIEDLKTFFKETFAKLFGSFSCLDSVGVCFKTLLEQLPTPLERAEACAIYIQLLKELREKAPNPSQPSSAGDTSLFTRAPEATEAASKASVPALLDSSQLITMNEATFTSAQTFLRDARRMQHRELVKQILLQHHLVTPQQLLAYDMKDPHLNSYVADLLREALSIKLDVRLVSRLFEYPTLLSRFNPFAVLSNEHFPAINKVLLDIARDLHKDISGALWETLDAVSGISALSHVKSVRLADVRPLQAAPSVGRVDELASRPDISAPSPHFANETPSARTTSRTALDSELVNKLVMVLAAVCTVDASHANEQLTARYRFLTGTTHAYIQHLLSNLQPKLEGTSSATQYLSKDASDFLMELLRVRVHLTQAIIGTFMESQFEAICNSPVMKLRRDLDGCLIVLLLHRVNLITVLPAHLLLESLSGLLRDGLPESKEGSASWWSNKKSSAMRLEFLCGLLTLCKTLVQAVVEQREPVSLLLERRSIDSESPTRVMHALGILLFKYLQMLRSLEVELDDKVSKSASSSDEALPSSSSPPSSASPELFNPRRATSDFSRRRFFEKLVHPPDVQMLAKIYFYHLSTSPVSTWLLLWSALAANAAPRTLFGTTFVSHSILRDIWSDLLCKLQPSTLKAITFLRNYQLTSLNMGQLSSHRAIAPLLCLSHALLRCPYHMPDSLKDFMPRDTVASTSRLFLALLNLFVAASNINFETFIRGFGSDGLASIFREMQAIRALSSIGSCGSTTPLVGSEMKDTAASGSDALHLVVDLGALPVCELVEPLERLVMARLACKPLEQLLVRAQPSAKGALAELSPSAAKPLLVAYIQFVLQLHRVPHIKSSVREVLALHLGDTIVAAGPSCLEEAAYLLRELERLPLLGSASSCQPTAARNSSRSSISAQPLARSVLQDVVNGSPLRTMNASPARRQRTAVLMHIAETLRRMVACKNDAP